MGKNGLRKTINFWGISSQKGGGNLHSLLKRICFGLGRFLEFFKNKGHGQTMAQQKERMNEYVWKYF